MKDTSTNWLQVLLVMVVAAVIAQVVAIFTVIPLVQSMGATGGWLLIIYLVFVGVCTLASGALSFRAPKVGFAHDWKVMSLIASSKLMLLVTVALSVVPLAVEGFKQAGHVEQLPFSLFMYWLSGLSLLVFSVLYHLCAPGAYRYPTFEDLIKREGSARVLRGEAGEILEGLRARQSPSGAAGETPFTSQDEHVLEVLAQGRVIDDAQCYFVMREHGANANPKVRWALTLALLIPAYVIPTVTVGKMFAVVDTARQQVHERGGWLCAIYGSVLTLGKDAKEQAESSCKAH
ncbi:MULTISPECIES: hypothetical protein [Pseudomonas]|uniref:hypothetical protein n=1 Tax=Pseudomonas TaxID=286 RepID=UPI00129A3992|nr:MULTISPECIES: hypothetical protein [Pseudomonas]MBH3460096.1 hypothetical protein [Pseudomonas putida]MBK0061951.1 hypothetical protein [Pseudomonas sp. S44]